MPLLIRVSGTGWPHVQGLMWTEVIVVFEPVVDDDLCLRSRREPLCIEHLAVKGSVSAFVVFGLPR